MKIYIKLLAVLSMVIGVGTAIAQTCIVSAPAAPPFPTELIIQLPPNGATTGCTANAIVPNGAAPKVYPIGNAKCATAVAIALQAAANDNGWNDGGSP